MNIVFYEVLMQERQRRSQGTSVPANDVHIKNAQIKNNRNFGLLFSSTFSKCTPRFLAVRLFK